MVEEIDDTNEYSLKGQLINNSISMDLSANLSCSILPLLQIQPTNNLTKHDVNNLVKTIIKM